MMVDVFDEYRALVTKVQQKADDVHLRQAKNLACQKGCAQCCTHSLSVLSVEAYAISESLSAHFAPPKRRADKCVFLDENDACTIYQSRPLLCRTHGLPIRSKQGAAPSSSLRILQEGVSVCALNFEKEAPSANDIIDDDTVQALVLMVDQRFRASVGLPEGIERIALDDIVAAHLESEQE